MKTYIVVENAGYEGENDITGFTTRREAQAWIAKQYEPDEIEDLHVMIAVDIDGEREY